MRRVVYMVASSVLAVGVAQTVASHHAPLPEIHVGAAAPTPDDALRKLVLKFHVTGTYDSFDPRTGVVTFVFSGPFGASHVDPLTGVVSTQEGPQLGAIDHARVHFTINPTTGVLNSDSARFTCDQCRMAFVDGSALRPLVADPANPLPQVNIPMEGRLLFDLGPIPGASPGTIAIRGAGCGGAREVNGRGYLANTVGALCMNGFFTFPGPLPTTAEQWAMVRGLGESDCSFVFHVPVGSVPYVTGRGPLHT
jgi:hypothetical protein